MWILNKIACREIEKYYSQQDIRGSMLQTVGRTNSQ